MTDFLGSELTHSAEKQTEALVTTLEKFVNLSTLAPEKRARYATAVVALLESPQQRVQPGSFIANFIDPEDRDLLSQMLPPQVRGMDFQKDTTLVRPLLGGLRLRMNSNVTISATPDALDDGTIEIEEERVIVNGRPDQYSLGKPPRR